MKTLSLDIGYRSVKSKAGDHELLIPAVVGPGQRGGFKSGLVDDSSIILDVNGQTFLVGEQARVQSEYATSTKDRSRTKTKEYILLFQAILSTLLDKKDAKTSHLKNQGVFVVSSLPIAHYAKDKAWVEETFLGKHKVASNGHMERSYSVKRVKVVVQGFGQLCQYTLGAEHDLSNSRVAIVDIGSLTSNLLLFDSLTYVSKSSTSIKAGMGLVHKAMIPEILRIYDREVSEIDADIALRSNSIKVDGNARKVKMLARPSLEDLAEKISSAARSLWDVKGLDLMLICGGGNTTAGAILAKEFKNSVIFGDEWSNARGQALWGDMILEAGK